MVDGGCAFWRNALASHYEGSKQARVQYLRENQIVTEKEAVKELKKTCLVIMDSQPVHEDSQLAWETI